MTRRLESGANASVVHSSIGPRDVRPFVFGRDDVSDVISDLPRIGIAGFTPGMLRRMMSSGMDALQPSVTPANITTPVQFLQSWLPGFVEIITSIRQIDELIGIATLGDWEDEEIIQGVLEKLGTSVPYTDYGNVPQASWNATWERRTIVRFEEGMRAGVLDEARAAKVRINSAEQKRESAALQLEIQRNTIGFFGFNGGNNRTYGFLNDPNLPAAVQFPENAASTSRDWSEKTALEIITDLKLGFSTLRTSSQGNIDPKKVPITVAVPIEEVDYLTTPTEFGYSPLDWLKSNYPRARVESAPELFDAVGGVSVCYFYAETVDDTSTDDKKTWIQAVPAKFRLIGVQQMAKGYEEDYSNATAGVMLKRPFAVARFLYA